MTSTAAQHFPGPRVLGRGAIIAPGTTTPPELVGVPRFVVDEAVRQRPGPLATVLHHHWVRREPVVLELAIDNAVMREPQVDDRPLHELGAGFSFEQERLHALTWANNWDLRSDEPVWWHAVLAERRLGAGPSDVADVRLADGTDAWCDGGPREPLDVPTIHRESIGLGRATPGADRAPTEGLADDQLAAVRHAGGAARVIAPAGSGKTRVLTARLRHLVKDRLVEPELVTAVAYNRRAADEMRSRLADVPGANVRTIHSLAWWICSLDERRDVIEERDVRAILDKFVRVGRVPNQDPFTPWLEALSEVRLALRDPEVVEFQRGDVDGLADVFDRFRAELARRQVLDFDEQVFRAIELLLTRPDIRTTVQRRCTHLLVDEFQDLTPAFLLLLRLAGGPLLQVFGVGDDDQVIYSYAGATPDWLIDYGRWFPGAAEYALETNYRCPPTVVEAAATLLGHNRRRLPKTIRAGRDESGGPLTVHRVPVELQATRAVTAIRALVDGGADPSDIAVLARVNSQLLPPYVALGEAGLPRAAPLDASVLGRTGIRTALAYVSMAVDPSTLRREHVLDTINRPSRKLKRAVEPFLRRERTISASALARIRDSLDETPAERLDGYLDDLTGLADAAAAGADTATLLRIVRDEVGLGQAMSDLDSSRTRPEGSSHADDLDALAQLAHHEPDPRQFRSWLVESLRRPGDENGIVLSTVHRVKGLEWPHVVVLGANDGLFPHRLADDVEEERRILHVAITRGQESVDVVAADDNGSPFLAQLHDPAPSRAPGAGERVTELLPSEPTWQGTDVVAEVGLSVVLAGDIPATVVEVGRDLQARTAAGVVIGLDWGDAVVVEDTVTRLVRRTAAAKAAASIPVANGVSSSHVLEALKAWRRERAAADQVPPYVILHDKHLEAIAARLPSTLRELAPCPGIGPTKLERYGDDILEVIEEAGVEA